MICPSVDERSVASYSSCTTIWSPRLLRTSEPFVLVRRALESLVNRSITKDVYSIASSLASCAKEVISLVEMVLVVNRFMVKSLTMKLFLLNILYVFNLFIYLLLFFFKQKYSLFLFIFYILILIDLFIELDSWIIIYG